MNRGQIFLGFSVQTKEGVARLRVTRIRNSHTLRHVSKSPTSRRSSFWLTGILASLALAVFCWGFGYKLSLYHPSRHSMHGIPTAKLVSRNEDYSAADVSRACICIRAAEHSITAPVFVAVLILSALTVEAERESGIRAFGVRYSWHAHAAASLNAFFFRPPPVSSAL